MKTVLLCGTMAFFALTCALEGAKPQTAQATPTVAATAGQASIGAAHQVIMDNLPQYVLPAGQVRREIPDHPDAADEENERRMGAKPSAVTYTGEPSKPPSGLEPTASTTLSFAGAGEAGCGNLIPSDHALASNGGYEVHVLNSCIAVHNASGTLLSGYPKGLNSFLGAPSGDIVGDIRAMYDWHANKFIVVAEDFTANNIYVAASTSAAPTGGWWIYSLAGTTSGNLSGCADFPMVGQTLEEDGDGYGAIYISFDRFTCGGGFIDDVIWALPKTKIYDGAGFSYRYYYNLNVGGKTVDHVQPANVMNQGDRPRAEFLINTYDFNNNCVSGSPCNGLVIWAFYNGVASGSAALTGATISTANNYIYPVTAAQPGAASGSTCAINTGNTGITGTVSYSAGDLFLSANTAALNGGASVGWIYWQVHPYLVNNSSSQAVMASPGAVIRNEICQGCNGFGGDGSGSEYYATPQPDGEGNVTVVFNYSDSGTYPSTAYLSIRSTQPTGSLNDGGYFLSVGQAEYCQLDGSNRNRWGDYTAASPLGTTIALYPTFWFGGQYSDSSGNWATTVAKTQFSYPNQPSGQK